MKTIDVRGELRMVDLGTHWAVYGPMVNGIRKIVRTGSEAYIRRLWKTRFSNKS